MALDAYAHAERSNPNRPGERRHRLGTLPDLRHAIVHAIRERYGEPDTFV